MDGILGLGCDREGSWHGIIESGYSFTKERTND